MIEQNSLDSHQGPGPDHFFMKPVAGPPKAQHHNATPLPTPPVPSFTREEIGAVVALMYSVPLQNMKHAAEVNALAQRFEAWAVFKL